ncbi:hypothetical protein EWI30_11905 [Enterobacter cloacae]|nr:hypothetical protein EWI30_11905 [Enterobacter cloacae]
MKSSPLPAAKPLPRYEDEFRERFSFAEGIKTRLVTQIASEVWQTLHLRRCIIKVQRCIILRRSLYILLSLSLQSRFFHSGILFAPA